MRSTFGFGLRDVGAGLVNRVQAGFATVRRTSRPVALLRGLVFGCLLGAWALAMPVDLLVSRFFLVAVAAALASALFPRTTVVTGTIVAIAVAWLFTTWQEAPAAWRVLAVMALLYVAHTSAALAALLPHDTAVTQGTLRRWAVRVLAVLGVSGLLGVMGMALSGQPWGSTGAVGPAVGALVGTAIVGIIVWQWARGRSRDS